MKLPIAKYVLLLISVVFLTGSCTRLYEEVTILQVDDVVIRRMNDVSIILTADITMNNPNSFDVVIENSDLKVMTDNKILGVANILEEVHIPANSAEKHRFVIETKYSKMVLENLQVVMSLAMQDSLDIRLRGDVRAKALLFSNQVQIDVEERVKF